MLAIANLDLSSTAYMLSIADNDEDAEVMCTAEQIVASSHVLLPADPCLLPLYGNYNYPAVT